MVSTSYVDTSSPSGGSGDTLRWPASSRNQRSQTPVGVWEPPMLRNSIWAESSDVPYAIHSVSEAGLVIVIWGVGNAGARNSSASTRMLSG